MRLRLLVLSVCFVAMAGYVTFAMEPEIVPLREPLSTMPMEIGEWSGQESPKLTDEVLAVLGVDEYVNRTYVGSAGVVGLYIGYYQSQRQGDTIHSPMNCLPGAGWLPTQTERASLSVSGRGTIEVNRVLIEKGLDQQVVLYWYQSRGRVVASEYWSKIFMVSDAIRFNRSDAALVRVVSPVLRSDSGQANADSRTRAFVQAIFPVLDKYLPL